MPMVSRRGVSSKNKPKTKQPIVKPQQLSTHLELQHSERISPPVSSPDHFFAQDDSNAIIPGHLPGGVVAKVENHKHPVMKFLRS